ncbi:MAG TPA: TRAP transporter substrate-binding protein [Bacteroidota bacterium]
MRYAFSIAILVLLSACGKESDVTVIKLAHGLDATHPVHIAMEFMAKRVAEKSDGKMRIDLYPSQQLGTERELIELLQIGSLGITKVSTSVLEGFSPSYSVFSLPYVFRDDEHRYKVLDGEVGEEVLMSAEARYLRGLTYYDAGSRSFYTKAKPILSPGDLPGMKIRTQESLTSVKMVNALGGSATPIAWGELYTALQQGVVDGAENNPPSFHTSRHYEVCKFYVLDEHTAVPDVVLISTVVWNNLTPEEQTILQEAADESAEYQKTLWSEATAHALDEVQKAGVQIIKPDKSPFFEKVAPLYEEYKQQSPQVYELLQRIQAVQ